MTDDDAGRLRQGPSAQTGEPTENRGSRRRSQWMAVPGRAHEAPDVSSDAAAELSIAGSRTRRRVVRYALPAVGLVAIAAVAAGIVSSKGGSSGGQPAAHGVATTPTVVMSLISGGGELSPLTPTGSAVGAHGSPSGSAVPTATVSVPPQVFMPSAVTDLAASSGSTSAVLSWTAVPHATGYFVYVRSLTQNQSSFSKLPFQVPSSPWTAGLLVNGDTYQFRLQSMNGNLAGAMSNIVKVAPYGPVPGGVSDLAASPTNGGAKLTWTKVANSSGYLVYQKDVSRGETAFSRLPYPLAGGPWTAGLLINGDTYQFQLRSTNGDEMGGLSNIVTVVPAA
jgi:hypothetical protein